MRAALSMALNDLRQRLRDRSFFIYGVIVPFALALIFSLLLGPLTSGAPLTAKLALVDEDGSLVSAGLRGAFDGVANAGLATWQTQPSVAAAAKQISNGDVDAVVVVPAGFGAAVLALASGEVPGPAGPGDSSDRVADEGSVGPAGAGADGNSGAVGGTGSLTAAGSNGGALDLHVVGNGNSTAAGSNGGALDLHVVGKADKRFAALVADGVAASYLSRLRSAVWASQVLRAAGRPVIPGLVFAQVTSAPDALSLAAAPTSNRQLDPTTYYAAGMAVFFVFFIVQLGVTGLLDEERQGTLARLLAAPITRRAIVAGKVLSSMVIGVVSMVVLAAASTLIMGADWGNPLGVLLLIVAVVAAAAGILMLVAGVARSAEAAGNVQTIIAITLGALGGAFFQLPQREGLLEWLQRASPHYWFMRGMGDVAGGGGVSAVGNDLLAILAFALVAGAIGWVALERRLNP